MQPETIVTASKLLERATDAGVFLSHSQERLHFKLAVNVFPEELKREILANKAALIAFLSQRESDGDGALSLPRIVPRPRETNELRASFAQQRLWFVDQMGGGSRQYNMPAYMRIRGRFDEDIAEQSLRCIIRRHEPLRTTFINEQFEGIAIIGMAGGSPAPRTSQASGRTFGRVSRRSPSSPTNLSTKVR